MAVKRITVNDIVGDVAIVEADLLFQAWPQWVSIVTAVSFVVFRPLVIIGIILFYVMRKRYKMRVSKTMLRANNGAWYIFDADLLERGEEQEI